MSMFLEFSVSSTMSHGGDKHFPSAELMTDEGVFELSMNHSPCLLQKFITHLYNFSSKDSSWPTVAPLWREESPGGYETLRPLLLPTAGIFFSPEAK